MKSFKDFLKDEEGLGTVEMVLLLGVLVAIAVFFGESIMKFVGEKVAETMNNADMDTTMPTQ